MRRDQGRLLAPPEVVARPPDYRPGTTGRNGINATGRNGTKPFRAATAAQLAGFEMLQAPALRQRPAAPQPSRPAPRATPGPVAGHADTKAWGHQAELAVVSVNRMNVLAVGLLLQVVLIRYAGLGHIASYIAQAIVSVQLSFLLSRSLTGHPNTPFMRAAAVFNIQQLVVTAVGAASYGWLEGRGLSYITANVVVTAALTPASVAASKLRLRTTGQRDRRAVAGGSTSGASPWLETRSGETYLGQEIAARRAKVIIALSSGALLTGCLLYALGRNWLTGALLIANLFNLTVATLESHWRFYALRDPEAAKKLAWPEPIRPGQERVSFTSIVCALDEAEAIGATLAGLIRQTHRRHQIIVSLRDHDAATIRAVREFDRRHPGRIEVIIARYDAAGKHAQLNGALPYCTGDYIGPIDSEDDVAAELLVHVEALIRRTNADIVQGAVQLMNLGSTWREWYKVHNVEEYRVWYSSRMAFQVNAGFVPLGGNTVYIRASLLRSAGGWPASPTEDCAAGVLMCTLYNARVVAAYSPALATREEVPGALFNKAIGSLFWQRVRWLQGIFQELVGGTWLLLPTRRQRTLAGYILASPILQAFSCALTPVAIASVFLLKMPISLAMFMFAPLVPMTLAITSMLTGIRKFGQDYGQKVRARNYASIVFLTPVYQIILAMAAVVAIAKYLRGDKGWYKTARLNEHRSPAARNRLAPDEAAA